VVAAKVSAFSIMDILSSTNYFEMFGLTPRFGIDINSLELSFRRLQTQLHPDRHVSNGEAEQRLALQFSTALNDGYRTLRHPVSRAQSLLNLAGKPLANVAVSPAFLMAQMEWHEAIEEACTSRDAAALNALSRRLKYKVSLHEQNLAVALDEYHDFDAAAQQVNELRFYEKLRVEIDSAQDKLDEGS